MSNVDSNTFKQRIKYLILCIINYYHRYNENGNDDVFDDNSTSFDDDNISHIVMSRLSQDYHLIQSKDDQ